MKLIFSFVLLSLTSLSYASQYECKGTNLRNEEFIVQYSKKKIKVVALKAGKPVDQGTDFNVVEWKEDGLNVNATGDKLLSHISQAYLYVRISVKPGQNKSEVKIGTPTVMSGMKWDKALPMTCL